MVRMWCVLTVLLFGLGQALAVQPDEILDDPALEERARAISQQLRCLVCQNESIDSSNADVARDLRLIVRERLLAGDTDEEIIDFVVSRYGDFVLLNPPLRTRTVLLWAAPILMTLLGLTLILVFYRNMGQRREEVAPLTDQEKADLKKYLDA